MKLFIHRAGRTARAGQSGTSYSIITPEELAYLNDLSIFVGRKYFDRAEHDDEGGYAELLSNPAKICYGMLPQSLVDEYQEYLGRVKEKNETTLEGLGKSVKNAMIKYNKTKDPASTSSVSFVHSLRPAIHPLLARNVDKVEEDLMEFKEQIRNFKPKQSVLEIGITKTNDFERIDKFQQTLLI